MTDVTLFVPPGAEQYPISHNISQYIPFRADHTDPASPWLVTVPPHVAIRLMHNGGFYVAPTSYVVHSLGSIRMRHPNGPRSCGWGGIAFEPDEDGVIEVPVEAIADLQSHGFEPAPPKEAVKAVVITEGPLSSGDDDGEQPRDIHGRWALNVSLEKESDVEPDIEISEATSPQRGRRKADKPAVDQGTDTTGHVWPKDEEGTGHPDEPAKV
jgi:hypothetical protein